VALAVELVHLATGKHVDMIILLAGDRDFVPAVTAAKHEGVIVRLVHGSMDTCSESLYQIADERVEINLTRLDSFKVRYKKITRDEPREIEPGKAGPVEQSSREELFQIFKDILTRHYNEKSQRKMLASDAGEKIKKACPDWAKKYKTIKIKNLVKQVEDRVLWETIGVSDYISLKEGQETPMPPRKGNPVVSFVVDNLKEYFTNNPGKSIASGPDFGNFLYTKDSNWKKKYHVKLLTDALDHAKEFVNYSGKGPHLAIRFK